MPIQIDQSNKIEKTNKNTAIAIANGSELVILITGKTKRKLQELFRQKGKPQLFVYKTFATCIAILLRESKTKYSEIVIDIEYVGKEKVIRSMIYETLGKFCEKLPEINFQTIGKKSKAHNVAYLTAQKKKLPNKIINFNEIKKIMSL
ncbi:MAG: hypothetical protein NTZ42_00605 [Candidatus Gribaldobacteria bacterium]|nr:hypothetical protein [Candidatus Gribaldobacteria bacterium]